MHCSRIANATECYHIEIFGGLSTQISSLYPKSDTMHQNKTRKQLHD